MQEPTSADLEGQRGTRASRRSKITKFGLPGSQAARLSRPEALASSTVTSSEPSMGADTSQRVGGEQPRRSDLAISRTQ